MKRSTLYVAGLAAVVIAIWYYRKRSIEIQQSALNPNESMDSALGSLASGYDRETGQTGDTRTQNKRYNSYLDYLKVGGTETGKTFDQYLTASEGQSLPTNS